MTLISDAKFEVKVAPGSKNDMTNLVNFNMSSDMSETSHFDAQPQLLLIAYKLPAKIIQKSYLS